MCVCKLQKRDDDQWRHFSVFLSTKSQVSHIKKDIGTHTHCPAFNFFHTLSFAININSNNKSNLRSKK